VNDKDKYKAICRLKFMQTIVSNISSLLVIDKSSMIQFLF